MSYKTSDTPVSIPQIVPAPFIAEGFRLRRIESGEEVWPCKCGKEHRGEYAIYDWAHCNCPHEQYDEVWVIEGEVVMCAGCGRSRGVDSIQSSLCAPAAP